MECCTCGKTFEGDMKFCPECGSKLTSKAALPSEADKTAAADRDDAPDSPTPAQAKNPVPFSKNKKIMLGAGAGVLVLAAIVGIVVFAVAGSGVPEDRVRQDIINSSIVSSGLVPGSHVNESPYELTEFKVSDQKKESDTLLGTAIEGRVVTFSGIVRNANFESSFSGTASYIKQGDTWELLLPPTPFEATSTPLKGIDSMSQSNSTPDDDKNVSEFQSDFKESNGSYTSTASEVTTYTTWFASDSVKTTQEFVFDQTGGWKTSGQPQTGVPATTYTLQGKSFSYAKVSDGTVECSISFKDIASDGTASADYTLLYTPSEEDSSVRQYHAADIAGSATGKLVHEAGSTSFSAELNDAEQSVTFTLANGNAAMQAGSGKVNALTVSVATKHEYYTSKYGSTGTLKLNYVTFPEAAAA